MNKELVFKKEMRAFDINVDDIKPDEHIFGAIEEAIIKMRNECLIDRLEVVLNNNLIDIKDKITDNRTILGCRLSYADLSKDASFIVRQDNEPTYEQLQQQNKKRKEIINKAIEYISNKKAIIDTDVIRIFDLFKIDEQGYTNELLDILKEVE